MGVSRFTTAEQLWLRKTKQIPEEQMNGAMMRGKLFEPKVRSWYEQLMGAKSSPLCVEHDIYTWLRASLDGYISTSLTVLEIKAPKREYHQAALDGETPKEYWVQCQHQLLVTEAKRVHYLSHHPSFSSHEQNALVEVLPDGPFMKKLFKVEQYFWQCINEKIYPSDLYAITVSKDNE